MNSDRLFRMFAAILIPPVAFFTFGRIGLILVPDKQLAKSAIVVEAPPIKPSSVLVAKKVEIAASPAQANPDVVALLANGDAAAGQKYTLQLGCIACHSFNDGGKNGLGPNLYGVAGRKTASHEGYTYSSALSGKGGVWTLDNLNVWLTKPAAYAPGTKMSYAGIADPKIRSDVIAYLKSLSASSPKSP